MSELGRAPELEGKGLTEKLEKVEPKATELTEKRALEDATKQPEAIVEHKGDFQQAESLEKIVSEMVTPKPEATSISEVPAQAKSGKEVVAAFSPEHKALYDSFSKEDQEAIVRMVEQSQKLNPHLLPGASGGIIY